MSWADPKSVLSLQMMRSGAVSGNVYKLSALSHIKLVHVESNCSWYHLVRPWSDLRSSHAHGAHMGLWLIHIMWLSLNFVTLWSHCSSDAVMRSSQHT